jgi:hypothetical protein
MYPSKAIPEAKKVFIHPDKCRNAMIDLSQMTVKHCYVTEVIIC